MNPQQPNNIAPVQQHPQTGGGTTTQPGAVQQPQTPQQSNPMQPFYAPNPTMGQATTLGPDLFNALSPNAVIQQIMQGFAPQAQQANTNLMDTLAAAGIAGGPAAGLQQQLQSQLASGIAPSIANAIMGSQGNTLQAALANMGAQNQMTDFNIGNLTQQQMANTGYANQAQDELANALLNAYGMNFNAFNNLNNAGLQGAMSLGNTNLGAAGNLASQEANNFPIYPSFWQGIL